MKELEVTVERSEEDWMAYSHEHDASAFADTPANALRELATVIELYDEVDNEN